MLSYLRGVRPEALRFFAIHSAARWGYGVARCSIHRYDMIVLAKNFRCPIPAARMIAPAMDQDQRRLGVPIRIIFAPIEIMQLQPLGDEGLRRRAGRCGSAGHSNALAKAALLGKSLMLSPVEASAALECNPLPLRPSTG